jgi:hypothetical protein
MGVRNFQFAQLHDGMAPQNTIYNGSASDSVVAALNGYNSCVLCYGQTGSGKTYNAYVYIYIYMYSYVYLIYILYIQV